MKQISLHSILKSPFDSSSQKGQSVNISPDTKTNKQSVVSFDSQRKGINFFNRYRNKLKEKVIEPGLKLSKNLDFVKE